MLNRELRLRRYHILEHVLLLVRFFHSSKILRQRAGGDDGHATLQPVQYPNELGMELWLQLNV